MPLDFADSADENSEVLATVEKRADGRKIIVVISCDELLDVGGGLGVLGRGCADES